MKNLAVGGLLAALLASVGGPAYADYDVVQVAGDCELSTAGTTETFEFDIWSSSVGFVHDNVAIPITVDGQELSLRVSHSANPTWHFAGREFPASRSFGASVRDSEQTVIAGKSMPLPYLGYDGQDVATVLQLGEDSRIVCLGVVTKHPG